VSRYGLIAFASSLDQIGPFAATVEDAALLLQVIGGHDPADSTSIPEPLPDYRATLRDGIEGLRVGIISELMGSGVASEVADRVRQAAAVLEGAGAEVAEVHVPAASYGISA